MIRKACPGDVETVTALALELWPHNSHEALYPENVELIESEEGDFFLWLEEGRAVGFAQVQLRRDYVEGTETSPVGYLEAVYVKEGFRRRGVGRSLVAACEGWARERGCTEFASDCELDNTLSLRFHLGVGFAEANRIICFQKKL